jgi:hypothetical protein
VCWLELFVPQQCGVGVHFDNDAGAVVIVTLIAPNSAAIAPLVNQQDLMPTVPVLHSVRSVAIAA